MKRFSEQFKKEADRTTLRTAESRELRERLVAYMEYHPLPADRQVAPASSLMSDAFVQVALPWREWRGAFAICVAITLIVVPFAAENSLPGDVLYPVKVSFNEEVRSSLSFSSYEKVEWETTRLERRLAEIRLLAGEGKLTEEVEAAAAEAVATHTAAAKRELAVIRESDGDGAAVAELSFATALEVQAGALASTLSRSGTSSSTAGSVTTALSVAKADVQSTEQAPTFPRLLALVEERSTEAQELFLSLKTVAGETIKADVERRLQDIERKRAEAVVYSTQSEDESGDISSSYNPDAARVLLKEALQATEKLILYMTDIELSNHVSVEDLVPATPTNEELQDNLTRKRATLDTQIKAVKARAGASPSEKVAFGLASIEQKITGAEAASSAGNFKEAISLTENATVMATDILRVLDTSGLPKEGTIPTIPISTSTTPVATTTASTSATILR